MIDAVTELATATSASTAAAGAYDDDDYDDTDSKNAIYATTKFEKSPAKSPEKVLDKSDSNTFFSYPGKGRTKFRSTLANLNDAAIIAIYGDNFESEPILQIRIVIMICVYLCPLASGFTTSLLSLNRLSPSTSFLPDWTDHLIFLGGLTGSVSALAFSLRLVGRIRTSALVSVLLFVTTVLILFSDASTIWMKRLAETGTGFALGLQLPAQYLITAETVTPKRRATLSVLNYAALAFGSLLPHLLSGVVRIQGLCILNCVILVTHFVVVGIFHPETPRYLFYTKDKKSDCVNSLQWLRGKRADIGMEYADMADAPNIIRRTEIRSQVKLFLQRQVLQPLITAATLMTLTSLSGLLTMTYLMRINFKVEEKTKEFLMDNRKEDSDFKTPIQIGYIVAGVSLVAPLVCSIFVSHFSRKRALLVSTSLMSATLIFLALIIHFQADNKQEFGWTIQAGAIVFLVAHHFGLGPLSWLYLSELIPVSAVEIGTALAASCWWAFNLVFSVTFESLIKAVGIPGLCFIHAVVAGLAYGFVLLAVPDVRIASLPDFEKYFAKLAENDRILPTSENVSDENRRSPSLK